MLFFVFVDLSMKHCILIAFECLQQYKSTVNLGGSQTHDLLLTR